MFLTEIPSFSPFFSAKKKHSGPNNFDLLSSSFDAALLRRLDGLSPPSISLSWLASAVNFLLLAHSDARSLIEVTTSASEGETSLGSYLDDTVKLLDVCNSVSAEIESLRQRRLRLALSISLLGDGEVRRARDSLREFESRLSPPGGNAEELVRDLAAGLRCPPRGKVTSAGRLVRRTAYAVGLVTVFVAGAVVSSLNGSPETVSVHAPAEFCWAEKLTEVEAAVAGELRRLKPKGLLLAEVDDVATRVREACEAMEKEEGESRNDVVGEAERAMESFSDGLEGLSKGVNEVFYGVLVNRNQVLDKVRVRA